jgi:predicted membrane protein (TIGR00267 family)
MLQFIVFLLSIGLLLILQIKSGYQMEFKIEHGRYIILGSVDGILAILGVVIGASLSGNPSFVINAAIGGAVALAMTNGAGSYLAEGAVEYGKLSRLEKPLLRSLENTRLEKDTKKKIRIDSITHGGASFIGSLIPILPFVILKSHQLEWAVGLSIAALAILGLYSGKIAKQSLLVHSVRMVGLGIAIVVAVILLGLEH